MRTPITLEMDHPDLMVGIVEAEGVRVGESEVVSRIFRTFFFP